MSDLEKVEGWYPLVGWRGYQLMRPHLLASGGQVIVPRTRNEAACSYANHDELAPKVECGCGFYAFKELSQLFQQGYAGQPVLAEVWLYGKVVEHELGFRAQHCYPKKLWVMDPKWQPHAPWLGEVYGCPCEVGMAELEELKRRAKEEEERKEVARKLAKEAAKKERQREYHRERYERQKALIRRAREMGLE